MYIPNLIDLLFSINNKLVIYTYLIEDFGGNADQNYLFLKDIKNIKMRGNTIRIDFGEVKEYKVYH